LEPVVKWQTTMMRRATIRQALLATAVTMAWMGMSAQHHPGAPAPHSSMPHSFSAPHPQTKANAPRPASPQGQRSFAGQQLPQVQQAPVERRGPGNQPASQLAPIQRRENGPSAGANGEHLAEWMQRHNTLSLPEQQRALQAEPGFRDLPGATQQRLMNRLSQLNAMPPAQRERMIQHNEAMERLTPEQRTQVRFATQNWASLPPDQKFAVARSFRALRQLPPDQRAAALASGRYTAPFNAQQRAALDGLLRVEPWLPADQ
jgi:hypothetical protein